MHIFTFFLGSLTLFACVWQLALFVAAVASERKEHSKEFKHVAWALTSALATAALFVATEALRKYPEVYGL